MQRAAEQRGAARSVREDTGCGAALDAESRSCQAGGKSSGADRRRRRGGVELEVRVSATGQGGAAPSSRGIIDGIRAALVSKVPARCINPPC